MNKLLAVVLVSSLTFAVAGCKKNEMKQMPAGQPGMQGAASPAAMGNTALSGKVTETMNAGGYTYVCLEKNGQKTWVAMPMTPVKVGQELALQPGAVMNNFTSKTLNRTFDSIIFSAGLMPAAGGHK